MSKYRARLFSRSVKPLFLLLRTCVFIVLVVDSDGYQEQKFAMEPQDQTAIIGSRVTLPCRVEKKSGQLQWTKDDFGLGLHRDLSGYDRYRMIGSDEEGDYSLDIREVTLDDEAKYQCQVSSGSSGEPPIRSRYAQLTVLVPPEPPKISQGETVSATEDARFDLECLSVGGKPPAEITWVDSNAGVITQGVTYSVEPMADGQRFTARSILKIVASEYHHNETFTCQAQNTADRAYKSASVTLDVRYSPKIKIENRTKTIKGRIPEGENLILECNAKSNPSNKTYKWYLNDEFVLAKKDLIINNITRDYNSVIAKCIVENEVGTSEATVNITVTYEPAFRTNILDYQADAGAAVILTCDVDSFPEAEIQWYHVEDGQRILVGRTTNMSLVADARTTGKYVCRASVEGYVPIENSAYLLIKGPPKILSNDTQTGVLGEMIKIECAAIAVPRIEKIVWTFDGKEIDFLHNQDYIFQEDIQLEGIVNSTLIIRESTNKHFGLYRCNVSNEYGCDSLDIYLRAGKNFPLLMILFGVTTGTMLVAGLIILVIICHRKQRNNKQRAKKPDVTVTAEDLFKENDRNSNISDLKMELRGNVSGDVDYSNAGSNSTLCSNAKLGTSVPLSGTIPLSVNQSKNYPYRYNEYTDPAFNDYKVNGYSNGFYTYVHYGHDYTPGSLKVQSPNSSEKLTNPSRSINGSLPRSADSLATVQFNGSHSNSLQRPIVKKRLEAPSEGSCEVTRLPNSSVPGIDVRYTTAYGNPHLKGASVIGYAAQVNTAKPASTPAPPPYSSVKNSIILPSGPSSHSVTSPTSLAGSPITSSTISADSNVPQISVATTSATPQSPSTLYILAPPSRAVNNSTITKKGNCHQAPMATHV